MALPLDPVEDGLAALREVVEQRLRVPRDLEARRGADEGRDGRVAQRLQTALQGSAIDGAEEDPGTVQRREVGAPPVALCVARHVEQHGVGMELRVEVAAREVPEAGGDEAVCRNPGPASGRAVVGAGLKQLPLGELEGLAHRLVVGPEDPGAGPRVRVDQGFEAD